MEGEYGTAESAPDSTKGKKQGVPGVPQASRHVVTTNKRPIVGCRPSPKCLTPTILCDIARTSHAASVPLLVRLQYLPNTHRSKMPGIHRYLIHCSTSDHKTLASRNSASCSPVRYISSSDSRKKPPTLSIYMTIRPSETMQHRQS